MSNQDMWFQNARDSNDQDASMRTDFNTREAVNNNDKQATPEDQKAIPASSTNQQKRQNSNSLGMSGAIKRSVIQPNSPSIMVSGNATPNQQPVESSRATAGTLTPALTSQHQHQHHQHQHQHHNYGQHYTQSHQFPSQQQQQPVNIPQQQQQMAPFKATFNIPSPTPQVPAKAKKFSNTFVNNSYQKQRTPDLPNSPNLSVNKTKFETSSYINDEHTDVNDFNEVSSVVLSQPTGKPTPMAPYLTSSIQHSEVQITPQPQIPPPGRTVLTKEANPDSPGSTISENSTAAQPVVNAALGPVGAVPAQTSKLSEEEQALILKLQDTYKNIIKLETDLQRKCQSLNLPQRLDMTELWDIYNTNITLLNSYYDFLLYSLSSGKSGKQIIQVYRVPRRLWVYGIVTFLDVLKNVVSIFIEHDICSSFIGYSFNILSGLTELEMEGWVSEKLGDLSRMAIALYPSRYIDWKISSEYWYRTALKTQYGFGKIYYHIATVQQDNLDALVNIGKSVFCRDTFVPTPQYMRMVIDNINQRNFVDLPVVDFIKVHKILLSSEFNSDLELIKLVSYYSQNIGIDNNKVNFFVRQRGTISEHIDSPGYNQDNDYENKLNFWFQRSSSFALVNICQIVGFGNSANPFARLFGLVEALKERKDRKDKKDRRKKSLTKDNLSAMETTDDEGINTSQLTVDDWFQSSDYINKNALELAMRMFKNYLSGPIIASTPHIITYLYFIISIGEALRGLPMAKPFFEVVLQAILPCDSLVSYLNEILAYVRKSKPEIFDELDSIKSNVMSYGNFVSYFNENESLIEVWKCWGTLWYDKIQLKEDFANFKEAGIIKDNFLDVPIGGVRYNKDSNNERFTRILLLACHIADEYEFGLKRGAHSFKYSCYNHNQSILEAQIINGSFQSFLNDARIQGISSKILQENSLETEPSTEDIFTWLRSNSNQQNSTGEHDRSMAYVDEADNEADYDDEEEDREQLLNRSLGNDTRVEGNIGPGMDSSLTFFVLDTNMWLKHCGMIYKCVRNRLFRLAVPLVVFQELRSLRRSPDANVSDAAVRAVITVRQLSMEGFVLALKMNGTEAQSLNDVKDFENNSTWMNTIDDTIINASRLLNINANNLARSKNASEEVNRGDNIQNNNNNNNINKDNNNTYENYGDYRTMIFSVLVTDDRNMRLKARTKLVPAYQGKWFFQMMNKISDGKCND